MAVLSDINSSTWGLSTLGYGVIVESLASIRQCLDIIIRTSKGTDPLRPFFGSDVYQYADHPLHIAIPNQKKAILDAVAMWETRVTITSITHEVNTDYPEANIQYNITYQLQDQDLIDQLTVQLNGDTITTSASDSIVILQAFFPPNPNKSRYSIAFLLNDNNAQPLPLKTGYADLNELFAWITNNWGFFGRWYQLVDRIVLYMNSNGVSSASIAISLISLYKYEALLPVLSVDESYKVQLSVNNAPVTGIPDTFTSPGLLVNWLNSNLSTVGEWSIEYGTVSGSLSDEFSDEFDADGEGYKLVLLSGSICSLTAIAG